MNTAQVVTSRKVTKPRWAATTWGIWSGVASMES